MTIQQRTVVDKIEILRGGFTQVRRVVELYDDEITPLDAIEEVFEMVEIEPEIIETITSGPNKGKTFKVQDAVMRKDISIEGRVAVTDVKSTKPPHRMVYAKEDKLPVDVVAFLDNAKGPEDV